MATRRSSARKKGGPLGFLGRIFRTAFVIFAVACAIGVGYGGAKLWRYLKDLPDVALVERYEPIEAIQLFDRNDHLICTVEGDEDRRVVPLSQVSLQMRQAMLAAEDHHFYEHHGINFMSIVRALLANLQAGHVVEGGSTITQQLVKNLFFTEAGRTFDRKIKEACLASELERRYSKERILEMYLNQVYFGNNAYGIERAASRYFDKTAAELSLPQAAFLAGLVKAPSELGNSANRKEAITRQHEILDKMVEYGYVTPGQAKNAKKEKLVFKKGVNPLQKYPYYVSYVIDQLRDRFSQAELRKQGLRVYTNLDPPAQEAAERVLEADIKKAPKGLTQLALVTVSVQDGAVLAMVGGVGNYWQHQFNRATNPHTAGSSFKPYVYLTAFIKGTLTPDSKIDDKPLVVHSPWGLEDYAPKNFDKKFYGSIPVRRALAWSRNVCSVRIAQMVGIDSVIETARLAGVTTKLEPNLSLALGSSAVTPLDQAGAYATFARMGVAIKPQVLRRIENNRGQVIEVFQPPADKVFSVEPVAELVDCMQDVVKLGTGTQARLKDRPVAGKTGTADEGKDIWFVGYTPDMSTAIWGGNDDNLAIPGQHVTGGDIMARIWRDYATAYYQAHPTPPGEFIHPSKQAKELKQEEEEKKPAEKSDKIDQLVDQRDINGASTGLGTSFEPTPTSDMAPETRGQGTGRGEAPIPGGAAANAPGATTRSSGGEERPRLQPGQDQQPRPAPSFMPQPAPSPAPNPYNQTPALRGLKKDSGTTIMMPMPAETSSSKSSSANPSSRIYSGGGVTNSSTFSGSYSSDSSSGNSSSSYSGSTPQPTTAGTRRLYPYTRQSKYSPVTP